MKLSASPILTLCAIGVETLALVTFAGEPSEPRPPQEIRHPAPVIRPLPLAAEGGGTASPYGVCAHVAAHGEFEGLGETLGMMVPAGVANIRCDFTWANIEKPKGNWDFSLCDEVVAKARAAGVTILPILDYSHPDHGEPHVDQAPWREYVRRVVERYAADCPVFEVWNEQDHVKGALQNPTNYLALLKCSYEEIKAAAPDARVAVGGFCGIPLRYIEELYKIGGGAYFDIMNIHGYSVPDRPEGSTLDVETDKLREIMAKYGDAGKPIWCTEVGWPTNDPTPDYDIKRHGWGYGPGVSDAAQAVYTSRALGLAMAKGYEKMFFYEFRETFTRKRFWRESHFGLVRVNFIPKPAWIAYATFTAMRPAGSVQKDGMWRDESRILYFPQWKRPDGSDAGMLWTTGTPLTTRLRFTTENVGFYNHLGKEIYPEPAEGGGYSVSVSDEPVYFVGGALEVE